MFKDSILLFFPKRCCACSTILAPNEAKICTNCRHEIPVINSKVFTANYLLKIFKEKIDIESFSALFYFEKHTEVQELLHNLKYRGHRYLGKAIGDWHATTLCENETLNDIDFVIPMPVHKKRLRQRGYNQVSLYAKTLANKLNVTYREDLLKKKKHKKSQVFLNRTERFNNILDSIYVEKISEIRGRHILLVDDLVTTGATMRACVSCLKEVNCKISIASIALVQNEGL